MEAEAVAVGGAKGGNGKNEKAAPKRCGRNEGKDRTGAGRGRLRTGEKRTDEWG
jgi:hypothetical protein